MQALVKLLMNALYGLETRKDNNEFYNSISQQCMETEYEDNVLDYWKLPKGNCIVKMKKDD